MKMRNDQRWMTMAAALAIAAIAASPAAAQKKYEPGANDSEIKVGNIMPYSGPASAYGEIGKTQAAYFRKVNTEGGANGRKTNFINYDDRSEDRRVGKESRTP